MPRLLIALSVLFLLPIPAPAAPPVVDNPADPPRIETWQLREVWRLDCDEDESLPLMGVITQAVADADGHVLLLDSQMAHVLEIGPDGEFRGTLSRSGQGPGEMERPNTLLLTSDGRLGLVQVFPGKVVWLNRDDTPAGQLSVQGDNPMFHWVREAAGNLVIRGGSMSIEPGTGDRTRTNYLASAAPDGTPRQIYLKSDSKARMDPPTMDEKGRWFPNRAWDLNADGSVLVADERDRYRLLWLEPDGAVRRVVTRDFEPHVRTKEERQQTLDAMRMWGPGGELEVRKSILDTAPAIDQVKVLDDGQIWVRSCFAERDLPDGIHCRFDVFDAEGRLESEVRIALPVNRDTDYFSLLNDGRFLWLRGMRSALDAVFANMEAAGGDQVEPDEADLVMQVILLEREE